MFFEFAVKTEVITQEDMNDHLSEAWKVLNQVADEQTELGKKHDEAQVLYNVYSELKAQNLIYTLPVDGHIQPKSGFDVDVDPHRPKTLVGYGPDENGLYYILMKTLIDKANDLLKGQGEINNLITVDGVLDALNSKGLLEIVKKKDGTYYDRLFQKRIVGVLKPVSAIKAEFFDREEEV
jgi:hypothetical protein